MFKSRILNQLLYQTVKQVQEYRLFLKPFSNVVEDENSCGVPDKLYKNIEVQVRGNEPAVLKSYSTFMLQAAHHLDIKVGKMIIPFKPVHQKWTLLKSKHVHKRHKVQYEMRTYYRIMNFTHLTGSTSDTFLEYVQRNLPEGVAMKVTKTEIQKLPKSITSTQI